MTTADIITTVCGFALVFLVGELRWTVRRMLYKLDDHSDRLTRLETRRDDRSR